MHVIHTLQVNRQPLQRTPLKQRSVIHTLLVNYQPLQRTPYNKACDSHITSHLSTITVDPIQQSVWFTHYKSPVNHYSGPHTIKHVIHTLQVTCQPLQQTTKKQHVNFVIHTLQVTCQPLQQTTKKQHVIHTLQFTCQPLQRTPYNKACDSHITSHLSTITADPRQRSMSFTQVITADHKQRSMIHTLQVNSQPSQQTPNRKASQLVRKMILMSSQPHRVTSGQSISVISRCTFRDYSHEPIPTQTLKKTHVHTHQTLIFEESVNSPFGITPFQRAHNANSSAKWRAARCIYHLPVLPSPSCSKRAIQKKG